MTTILTPRASAVPVETRPRMLAIGANLLPSEIVESRRARKARRIVLSALAMVVALLTGWYGLASLQEAEARSGLNNAETNVQRLTRQQNAYGDLVSTQAKSKAISAQLSTLLASDLQWSRLLTGLQDAAPEGVRITTVTGGLMSSGSGAGSTGPALPNTTGQKLVGSLTITGTAGSKAAVAEYVDTLAKVPGLGNPFLTGTTPTDGAERFTVRVDITASALGGRYPGGK